MTELARQLGTTRGVAAELSRRTQVPGSVISQFMHSAKGPSGTPRGLGDKQARKLEVGMAKPLGWMDQPVGTKASEFDLDSAQALRVAAAFSELSTERKKLVLQLLAEFGKPA